MTDPSDPPTASQLAEPKPEETRGIPSLGAGGGDRTAAVIRSVISNIPIVGQALAEVITEIVPNQRIERVEKYLLYLSEEIDSLRIANVDAAMKKPENVDLIEDGAYQAVRALSDERKRYLARAVAQGIRSDEKDKLNEKRVLVLIGDLDDGDLLLLDAFASRNKGREKFAKLRPAQPTINNQDPLVRERWGLYQASIDRLTRLSLLNKHVDLDSKTKLPSFDTFTGEPKGNLEVTALGRLVLNRAGLTDPNNV
ncbi:hypothetical protein [Bradyrhizobium sp. URHD0069]|uniref:hypothetical protein n=1 Tax=Bradyrhizobium sp. URHD0069 TaxID=1380355 RepID=UPI000497F75F|nr:hypothetical protein [Bradyrhizobium sp. URHD0069]